VPVTLLGGSTIACGCLACAPDSDLELSISRPLVRRVGRADVDPVETVRCRTRLAGGKFTVTDGPFTEAKELIAGFAILQTKTKAEAIEWAKRFLEVAGDGVSEVRLLHEATDFGPQ
jgi:hypothetical protein